MFQKKRPEIPGCPISLPPSFLFLSCKSFLLWCTLHRIFCGTFVLCGSFKEILKKKKSFMWVNQKSLRKRFFTNTNFFHIQITCNLFDDLLIEITGKLMSVPQSSSLLSKSETALAPPLEAIPSVSKRRKRKRQRLRTPTISSQSVQCSNSTIRDNA